MRTAGIVCEYNPFHTGHGQQIEFLRSQGYTVIICAMSGNFTQRGELAIADKYTRAEAAVRCGADVVLELPFPYSSLSAEGFARSGVHILAGAGADTLCFGSECADVSLLTRAADVISGSAFSDEYASAQRSLGSASAFFDTLSAQLGKDVPLLSNDILAVSYIAAIRSGNYSLDILPILRDGAAYSEKELINKGHPSATAIRRKVYGSERGFYSLDPSILPQASLEVLKAVQDKGFAPVFADAAEKEILSFFRLMTPKEISARAVLRSGGGRSVAEEGCGLLSRICAAAQTADSLAELLSLSYNSRFTDARVNRVLLFALLGVSDAAARSMPSCTVLLAASEAGRKYLSDTRKNRSFPIITKPADAPESSDTIILRASDALYASAMPKKNGLDHFVKQHPFTL